MNTGQKSLTAHELALYLGQLCVATPMLNPGLAIRGHIIGLDTVSVEVMPFNSPMDHRFLLSEVKPLLRPLSSLTEEEAREVWGICSGGVMWTGKTGETCLEFMNKRPSVYFKPTRAQAIIGNMAGWRWLPSKGFDLFDWIPVGLAIDKTAQP
jgi:hypothetical protein